MKTILFFDTETTGKAMMQASPNAPGQPRLVQLGAILCDENKREIASVNLIVRPFGFEIPAEASAIHGITTDMAIQYGTHLPRVLEVFYSLGRVADAYACHNADFDVLVMTGELARNSLNFPNKEIICTMRHMTPVCQIPGKYSDYKWPNLQEAHTHCFQKPFEGAHDAMADVRACRDVYFWWKEQNGKSDIQPVL